MSIREFASQMRQEVELLKQNGTAAIFVDNLINYLSSVERSPEPNPSPADIERYRAELNHHLETFKHQSAASLEMFRSVIQAGQNSIRSMILINGGAAVAMLAFLGHMARENPNAVRDYADCLLPFTVGTLLGGLVSGSTYLSQWLYGAEKPWSRKAGLTTNVAAIILGVLSYGAFGLGAWMTYDAFANLPTHSQAE